MTKSVDIRIVMRKADKCLNTKYEWEGSKITGMRINIPKGKVKEREAWNKDKGL